MGWSEYQYYTASPYMLFCACEGYLDKLEDTAALFRNLAGIVNRSMGGKSDMNAIWPLHNDPKPGIIKSWTAEELEENKKKANALFAKMDKKI